MEMIIQVKSETGEDINGAEVYVNGEWIGRTPNVVMETSSAVWKHYFIKVKCDGYNEIEVEAVKEPKFGIIIVGFFFLWWLWLWSYGPKSRQKITLSKKKERNSIFESKQRLIKFIGKNWKDILLENNLGEYFDLFENDKLTDLEMISELTESDLEKLGISIMGDRKKILKIFSQNEFSKIKPIDVLGSSPFIPSHKVKLFTDAKGLGLRKEPNPSSDSFTKIPDGTEVQYLSTAGKVSLKDKKGYWYEIITKDRIRGWCFSGSLEEI
jgi:hypothetical protein